MSLGDAIFLSALVISIVVLYATTKDRWRWRRIAMWLIAGPLALASLGVVGLWGYETYMDRPTAQYEFGAIRLGSTMDDVRFKKGEPSKKHSDDVWQFDEGPRDQPDSAVYVVTFQAGKVRSVRFIGTKSYDPSILRFTSGSLYEDVVAKLGAPDHTSTSKDGLSRMISYDKYQVVYGFKQGRVALHGIYDPALGAHRFSEDAGVAGQAK